MFGLKLKNKNDKIWLIISTVAVIIIFISYLFDYRATPSSGLAGASIGNILRIVYLSEFPQEYSNKKNIVMSILSFLSGIWIYHIAITP